MTTSELADTVLHGFIDDRRKALAELREREYLEGRRSALKAWAECVGRMQESLKIQSEDK